MGRDNWVDWKQLKPKRRSRCKMFLASKARKRKDRLYDDNSNYEGSGDTFRAGFGKGDKKPR